MNTMQKQPYIGSPENPRTVAIISYITFIGWLLAVLLLLPGHKTKFSAFHLRQSFLLHIFSFLLQLAYGFTLNADTMVFAFISFVGFLLFVLWFMGFYYALNGLQKAVPLIGRFAQNWFRNWWMW